MMKRGRTEMESDTARTVKRFSKSEIQTMVDKAVYDAVKQTEAKMDSLQEKVQQLECEPKFDLTIRHLEAHIKKVKRRGDAAMNYVRNMTKGKSGPSNTKRGNGTAALSSLFSDSKEDLMKTTTTNKVPTAHGEGKEGETENNPSSSSSSPQKSVRVKQEPVDPEWAEQEEPDPLAEDSRTDTHTDPLVTRDQMTYPLFKQDQDDLLSRLPPVPLNPFPSTLPAAAALYTLPPKPCVSFARIRHPPSLGVMWDIKDIDTAAPPIDSYSIFMAQESSNGSGVYAGWQRLAVVKAIPMPMAISLLQYRPGRRMCFIVGGKDQFGRYGPYSDVGSVVL